MSPKSPEPPTARGAKRASRASRRFAIRSSPFWRPLLVLFGATASRSYVMVEEDFVEVRFGFFHRRFARERIAAARQTEARWWYGVGWHTDLVRSLILNGSLQGMVELGEEIFHMPVRIGVPRYAGALAEVLRTPRYATAMGLLYEGAAQMEQGKLSRQSGSVKAVLGRMREWFQRNF